MKIETYTKVDEQHGLAVTLEGWLDPGDWTTPPDGEETVVGVDVADELEYGHRLCEAGLPPDTDPQDYYNKVLA